MRAIPFGIAAMLLGFALKSAGAQAGAAETDAPAAPISGFGRLQPKMRAGRPKGASPKRHVRLGPPRNVVGVEDDGRTAVYDFTAGPVYLPSGRRLEAHSGLGGFMDNPRHVHVRMHGATPPNLYNLTLRERMFHGVRAIRLNPVDGSRMYGRAGILAHTYMLTPNGQSNPCVSFIHYPEFLNAFLRGEVTRLAVVERLDGPPGRLAAGQLPQPVKDLWKTPDRRREYAAVCTADARPEEAQRSGSGAASTPASW